MAIKSNDSEKKPSENRSLKLSVISGLKAVILQSFIPMTLSFFIIYWIAGGLRLWKLSIYLSMPIVILSFLILDALFYLVVEWIRKWWTEKISTEKQGTTIPRGKKIVRGIIFGFVIPGIVTFLLSQIPTGPNSPDTYLKVITRSIFTRGEYPFISDIGTSIITSTDLGTKASGISTLQIIHSRMCLEQLIRVFKEDRNSIKDQNIYDLLSSSFASYGKEAIKPLLEEFHLSQDTRYGAPRGPSRDLFTRYFNQQFMGLEMEIGQQVLDPSTIDEQLNQIRETKSQLISVLSLIEKQSFIQRNDDPTLEFIFDSFLNMDINYDEEMYYLAKNVADDGTYSDSVRGKALLLVAKLGNKTDYEQLVKYISCNNEFLKAQSFIAIADLHQKLYQSKEDERNKVK